MQSPARAAQAISLLRESDPEPNAAKESIGLLEDKLGLPPYARRPAGFAPEVLEGIEALLRFQGHTKDVELRLRTESTLALLLQRNGKLLGDRLVMFLVRRVRSSDEVTPSTQAFALRALSCHLWQLQPCSMQQLVTVQLEPILRELAQNCCVVGVATAVVEFLERLAAPVLCTRLSIDSLVSLVECFIGAAIRPQPDDIRRLWAQSAACLLRHTALHYAVDTIYTAPRQESNNLDPRTELGLIPALCQTTHTAAACVLMEMLPTMVHLCTVNMVEHRLGALEALHSVLTSQCFRSLQDVSTLALAIKHVLSQAADSSSCSLMVPLHAAEVSCWGALVLAAESVLEPDYCTSAIELWRRTSESAAALGLPGVQDPAVRKSTVSLAATLLCAIAQSMQPSQREPFVGELLDCMAQTVSVDAEGLVVAEGCAAIGQCLNTLYGTALWTDMLEMIRAIERHARSHPYWLVRVKGLRAIGSIPVDVWHAKHRCGTEIAYMVVQLFVEALGDSNSQVRGTAAQMLGDVVKQLSDVSDETCDVDELSVLFAVLDYSRQQRQNSWVAHGVAQSLALMVTTATKCGTVSKFIPMVNDILACTVHYALYTEQAGDVQLHVHTLDTLQALCRAMQTELAPESWRLCFKYAFVLSRLVARAACALPAVNEENGNRNMLEDMSRMPDDCWLSDLHERLSRLHQSSLRLLHPQSESSDVFSTLRTAALQALGSTLVIAPMNDLEGSSTRLRSVLGAHLEEAPLQVAFVLAEWMEAAVSDENSSACLQALEPLFQETETLYLNCSSAELQIGVLKLCCALNTSSRAISSKVAAAALESLKNSLYMSRAPTLLACTLELLMKCEASNGHILPLLKQVLLVEGADQCKLLKVMWPTMMQLPVSPVMQLLLSLGPGCAQEVADCLQTLIYTESTAEQLLYEAAVDGWKDKMGSPWDALREQLEDLIPIQAQAAFIAPPTRAPTGATNSWYSTFSACGDDSDDGDGILGEQEDRMELEAFLESPQAPEAEGSTPATEEETSASVLSGAEEATLVDEAATIAATESVEGVAGEVLTESVPEELVNGAAGESLAKKDSEQLVDGEVGAVAEGVLRSVGKETAERAQEEIAEGTAAETAEGVLNSEEEKTVETAREEIAEGTAAETAEGVLHSEEEKTVETAQEEIAEGTAAEAATAKVAEDVVKGMDLPDEASLWCTLRWLHKTVHAVVPETTTVKQLSRVLNVLENCSQGASVAVACAWHYLLPWLQQSVESIRAEHSGMPDICVEVEGLCERITLQWNGFPTRAASQQTVPRPCKLLTRLSSEMSIDLLCTLLDDHDLLLGDGAAGGFGSTPAIHQHALSLLMLTAGERALTAVKDASADAEPLLESLELLLIRCADCVSLPEQWGRFERSKQHLICLLQPGRKLAIDFPDPMVRALICGRLYPILSCLLCCDGGQQDIVEALKDPTLAPSSPSSSWPTQPLDEDLLVQFSYGVDEHTAVQLLLVVIKQLDGCWFAGVFRHLWALFWSSYLQRNEMELSPSTQMILLQAMAQLLIWRHESQPSIDTVFEDGLMDELLALICGLEYPVQLRFGTLKLLGATQLLDLVSTDKLVHVSQRLACNWAQWGSDSWAVAFQVLVLTRVAVSMPVDEPQQPGSYAVAISAVADLLKLGKSSVLAQAMSTTTIRMLLDQSTLQRKLVPLLDSVNGAVSAPVAICSLRLRASLVSLGLELTQRFPREAEEGGTVLTVVRAAAALCEHPQLPLDSFSQLFGMLRQLLLSFSVSHIHRQRIITTALPWASSSTSVRHRCDALNLLMSALLTGEDKDTSLKLIEQLISRAAAAEWPSEETMLLVTQLPALCAEVSTPMVALDRCLLELVECPGYTAVAKVAADSRQLLLQTANQGTDHVQIYQRVWMAVHSILEGSQWKQAIQGHLAARCQVVQRFISLLGVTHPPQVLNEAFVLTAGLELLSFGTKEDKEKATQAFLHIETSILSTLAQAQMLRDL